jgi:hypothetical protein
MADQEEGGHGGRSASWTCLVDVIATPARPRDGRRPGRPRLWKRPGSGIYGTLFIAATPAGKGEEEKHEDAVEERAGSLREGEKGGRANRTCPTSKSNN